MVEHITAKQARENAEKAQSAKLSFWENSILNQITMAAQEGQTSIVDVDCPLMVYDDLKKFLLSLGYKVNVARYCLKITHKWGRRVENIEPTDKGNIFINIYW